MSIRKWRVLKHNDAAAKNLAEKMKIPFPLAVLLQTRGFDTPEKADLLSESPSFSDPFQIPGMKEAASRITAALDGFEKIAVYGDYDADGVTATAVLYSYLESCGGDVVYYIPEREGEGYGLNCGAVDTLNRMGVKLIVTVDNGISSVEEVAYANSLGVQTVVTDHHRPREVLPPACAVADPYLAGDECPYRDFAGVGVAFKLIMAMEGPECDVQGLLENYADLVAIGTVGDVVPLTGENRAFVRMGLKLLPRTDRPGLRALIEQTGLEGKQITSENVAFLLVPRINATGRIGSPDRAVRLLISESPGEAGELASAICDDNTYRRQIEGEIYQKVLERLDAEPSLLLDRVLVVEGKGWHHGVIGIVASRVTERFGKPCVILSTGDGEARGSGRSIEGFSLFKAVCACRDLLTKFGGHPMAAGMTLPEQNIPKFREQINRYAVSLGKPMPVPVLRIDCMLSPEDFTVELPELAGCLEPFGTANPNPLYGLSHAVIRDITPVGGGKHLRVGVKKGNYIIRCMKFGTTLEEFRFRAGDEVDLALSLESREYRGEKTLSAVIRGIKLSRADPDAILRGKARYEKFRRKEPLTAEEAGRMIPNRGEFAAVFRALRSENGFDGLPEQFLLRMPAPAVSMEKFLIALDVFAETGLICKKQSADAYKVGMIPVKGKVRLETSGTVLALKKYKKAGEQNGVASQNV